ncbi:hypothetical protein [Pimelobacter simplex]|uniref:hypothetical protein n=1 Tax=Nocardioides simplex TaxID=2045 RepID=UPI00215000E6|nr:hypothetical protein [Pimelobacter simplex]UUW92518.1 hypothetical protein M0M43_13825 [Pimelobacter simplex]UUW96346.1 hypothetical protein M0M48_02460 [Pimelobacter simplex]
MLLGALRRSEVLGLSLDDIRVGERRLFIAWAAPPARDTRRQSVTITGPATNGRGHVDLIDEFAGIGAAMNNDSRRRAARAFFARFGDTVGWQQASLADQLAAQSSCGRFVAWLILTGRMRPSADYLLACRGHLAFLGDHVHPQLSAEYARTAEQLGFSHVIARRQWSALLQIAALTATSPTRLTAEAIDTALAEFRRAADRLGQPGIRNMSANVFGLNAVLFHLGCWSRSRHATTAATDNAPPVGRGSPTARLSWRPRSPPTWTRCRCGCDRTRSPPSTPHFAPSPAT